MLFDLLPFVPVELLHLLVDYSKSIKILVTGGGTQTDPYHNKRGSSLVSTCWLLNVDRNEWCPFPSLLTGRAGHSFVRTEKGQLYTISNEPTSTCELRMDAFDFKENKWILLDRASRMLPGYQTVYLQGCLIMNGGLTEMALDTSQITCYHPETRSWNDIHTTKHHSHVCNGLGLLDN